MAHEMPVDSSGVLGISICFVFSDQHKADRQLSWSRRPTVILEYETDSYLGVGVISIRWPHMLFTTNTIIKR